MLIEEEISRAVFKVEQIGIRRVASACERVVGLCVIDVLSDFLIAHLLVDIAVIGEEPLPQFIKVELTAQSIAMPFDNLAADHRERVVRKLHLHAVIVRPKHLHHVVGLAEPSIHFLQCGYREFLSIERLLLCALVVVARHYLAHAPGGDALGIVHQFHEDGLAYAVVALVQPEGGVHGGSASGKGI